MLFLCLCDLIKRTAKTHRREAASRRVERARKKYKDLLGALAIV